MNLLVPARPTSHRAQGLLAGRANKAFTNDEKEAYFPVGDFKDF